MIRNLLLFGLLGGAGPALAQMQPPASTSLETKRMAEAKELEKLPASVEALDAKNGFRQYKLDSPITDYPNLKPRANNAYLAPNESMLIGDAKLMTLAFVSYKGKLAGIALGAMGEVNSNKLLEILIAQYGPGQEAGYQKLAWVGGKVTMSFEKKTSTSAYRSPYSSASIGSYCEVYITSNSLVAEMNAEKNAAAKKAGSDL